MAGSRGRCFYCSDSRGADVDHYWPIARKFVSTFEWGNLLWVCPECNRKKSARFPVDGVGGALLVDPTLEDPWSFLVLDVSSGVLAPRFNDEGEQKLRGAATLQTIDLLNFEVIVEGRARTIRRLREAVGNSLDDGDTPVSRAAIVRAVRDDEYGVASWFILWEGRDSAPFDEARARQPALWRLFARRSLIEQYGN